jgi:hypothetical protein
MNKFKGLIYFFIVFVLTSCFSNPPPKNNTQEGLIYAYQNQTTEYIEIECISLSMQSNTVMYSHERGNALVSLEIGSYSITDGVITINTKKIQATGTISDEKIVINDKVFIRYKK